MVQAHRFPGLGQRENERFRESVRTLNGNRLSESCSLTPAYSREPSKRLMRPPPGPHSLCTVGDVGSICPYCLQPLRVLLTMRNGSAGRRCRVCDSAVGQD